MNDMRKVINLLTEATIAAPAPQYWLVYDIDVGSIFVVTSRQSAELMADSIFMVEDIGDDYGVYPDASIVSDEGHFLKAIGIHDKSEWELIMHPGDKRMAIYIIPTPDAMLLKKRMKQIGKKIITDKGVDTLCRKIERLAKRHDADL